MMGIATLVASTSAILMITMVVHFESFVTLRRYQAALLSAAAILLLIFTFSVPNYLLLMAGMLSGLAGLALNFRDSKMAVSMNRGAS